MTRFRLVGWAPLALLSIAGCTSSDPDSNGGTSGAGAGGSAGSAGSANTAGTSGSGGTSVAPDVHGSVVISLNAASDNGEGHTALLARFFDGPTPNPAPLVLDTTQGDCQLLVPDLPFCNDPCSPDVCTADDVCTPYPNPRSVGTLSVSGLSSPLALEPATSMFVYQPPSLPNPPCDEGADIVASSAGFELTAQCITQLELTGADPIPVMSGQPVHVSWAPPSAAGSSRVRITLDISHHGGKKGEIDCDVPDTGSFDIPEPLVTKLVGLGLAGYPTINVNRVSVDVAAGNENISLVVTSDVTRAVDTGVLSCQGDEECPDGQTCQDVGVCD